MNWLPKAWRRRGTLRFALWVTLAVVLIALTGWLALPLVPLPPALFREPPPELEFVDRTGHPLRAVRPDDGPFRQTVAFAQIPRIFIEATLAAEDRRFWRHPGVDWRASARAAWQLVRHRRVISGGSTITQQLIKLAEPRPRTARTKLLEALQALRLDQVWDKQRILSEYMNRLDYGNYTRGCAAAAQFYFAKPLRDLSPAECALLAGLPQAPTRLNPHLHFERAVRRQQWILGQMRQAGWLTEEEYRRALAEPLHLAAPQRVFEAPHFVDLLLATTPSLTPAHEPSIIASPSPHDEGVGRGPVEPALQYAPPLPGPLLRCAEEREQIHTPWFKDAKRASGSDQSPATDPIRTTLDLALNRFAGKTLRRHLARLQAQHVSNGALVILDNQTGDVLALVGSDNYFAPDAGQVNGAWARRSAGSTFKPFTYLLALERGATPATVVADVPTEFITATGLFAPANYDRHCYGPMRYRLALANSLNIAAVKVLAVIGGPEPLRALLQRCGLSTLDRPAEHYGLGLTIGNAEARLLELANAYACLARLGEYKPYRLLAAPEPRPPLAQRVADPAAAYLIADILGDNDARALAFGAESALRFDFPVACKTGTSSDFRDNWAFGFTPEFTVGVWVGNMDGSPMQRVSGVSGAAPILHELFEHLHAEQGTTWYSPPTNVVAAWVHPLTGRRLRQIDPSRSAGAIKEKFIASNLPPFESPEDYAATSMHAHRQAVRLDSEYRDWLASGDNWLGDRVVAGGAAGSLRILFPPPGTTLFLDADLPGRGRRVFLRAAGPENLFWHSDTLPLIQEGGRPVALLAEGRHRITVQDPLTSAGAQTWIEVSAR